MIKQYSMYDCYVYMMTEFHEQCDPYSSWMYQLFVLMICKTINKVCKWRQNIPTLYR